MTPRPGDVKKSGISTPVSRTQSGLHGTDHQEGYWENSGPLSTSRYIQRQNQHGTVWTEASGVPAADSTEVRGWGTDGELEGWWTDKAHCKTKRRDGRAKSDTLVSDSNSLRSHFSTSMRALTPSSHS